MTNLKLWLRSAFWAFNLIWIVVIGSQGVNAALSEDENLEGLIFREFAVVATGYVAWLGFWLPQAHPIGSLFLFFGITIYRVLHLSQRDREKSLVENARKSARVNRKPPSKPKSYRKKGR